VERAASQVDGRVTDLRVTPEGDRRLSAAVGALGRPTELLAALLQDAFPASRQRTQTRFTTSASRRGRPAVERLDGSRLRKRRHIAERNRV